MNSGWANISTIYGMPFQRIDKFLLEKSVLSPNHIHKSQMKCVWKLIKIWIALTRQKWKGIKLLFYKDMKNDAFLLTSFIKIGTFL